MDFTDRNTGEAKSADVVDLPPPPEEADPEDVNRYNEQFVASNPDVAVDAGRSTGGSDPTNPFAKSATDRGDPNWKSEFPWLYDPGKGVRWDFDPVELRVLSQENAWVGMLVSTIATEIGETSWTIVDEESVQETDKRLSKTPGERDPLEKDLPDATAEEIYDRLRNPTPDHQWTDAVEMWMRDYLEVGNLTAAKVYDERYYDDDGGLAVDADDVRPLHLRPSAPEVWTKDYGDKSGVLSGYWQFARNSMPGGTSSSRGVSDPIHFDRDEVMWSNHAPASNRRYGIPPTLLVKPFLQSVDLAVTQEQEYLSRGSIPSGAWVFEEWSDSELQTWKDENGENVKGKPHKSLLFAGKGGDVRYEAMSMNFKELEFTERMKWYARVIASAFQVPTAVVGIEPEQVNYNTFQGERETFETNTLGPYLQDLERTINNDWMSHWDGYRFEFTPGMSETTKQMRSERVRAEWDANLRTRSDAARDLGIDVPEDAEDGFKDDVVEGDAGDGGGPFAMSASDASDGVTKDDGERDGAMRNTPDAATFNVQPGDVEALQEAIADPVTDLYDLVLDDDEIAEAIDTVAADADAGEDTSKSVGRVARRLRELLRESDAAERIQSTLESFTEDAAADALERASREVGEDVDVDAETVRARLRDREQTFADSFANRMAADIRETVGDGFADGKNSMDIADDIAERADMDAGWGGAERIARQELQIATGEARSAFAEETGKVEVWQTSSDGWVREAHGDMGGMWKRPGESWVVDYSAEGRGVEKESVPGDSEPGIGCRCMTLLRDRGEVDAENHAGSDGL